MIRALNDRILIGGQIAPDAIASLAEQGVTTIVNNRPDGEEPDQPLAADIEAAAERAGIRYRFVPIIRGIGPGDVESMSEAFADTNDGKLFAFCRSGMRSALACALALRNEGTGREEVERDLLRAGFDPGPIAHLL